MTIERWAIPTAAFTQGCPIAARLRGAPSDGTRMKRLFPVNRLYGTALWNSRVRIWVAKTSKGCALMDASPAVSSACPHESRLLTFSVPREAKFAIMTVIAHQVPCFLVCLLFNGLKDVWVLVGEEGGRSPFCVSLGLTCTVCLLLPPPWLPLSGFHLTTQSSLHVLQHENAPCLRGTTISGERI